MLNLLRGSQKGGGRRADANLPPPLRADGPHSSALCPHFSSCASTAKDKAIRDGRGQEGGVLN